MVSDRRSGDSLRGLTLVHSNSGLDPLNINTNSVASSLAGTHRAVNRGGEKEKQTSDQTRIAIDRAKPSSETTEVNAGDQTRDRQGNGRQPNNQDHHEIDECDISSDLAADPAQGIIQTEPQIKSPPRADGSNLDVQA